MTARRTAVTTVTAGVLVAGSVTAAYAYLSGGGLGGGLAATGTSTTVTLSPGTAGSALYPSASAAVALVATNPNPGPVRIRSLALDTTRGTAGFAVDAGHAGCGTSAFTFTGSDNGGLGWTVAGGGSLGISLPAAVAASATTASACQGASVTVYLAAT